MNQTKNTSPGSPDNTKLKKHNVNWHEAATCAVQIELRDYADTLEFKNEYVLGKNHYRIDMLIIKKLTEQPISKNIARIFQSYNLLEIKGIGSSVKINTYYKTIGYAGLLINQLSTITQYTALDVTITFLSFHYPRKLMKHLICERDLSVVRSSPGIYYINKETFFIQIIVTKELLKEENLYLRCLTNQLKDKDLINKLSEDYKKHRNQEIYIKYLHQITTANSMKKGESLMVCEGLLNLFGTSSEEIIARTKKEDEEFYLPKINELSSSNEQLISSNQQLTSSNQQLSAQNNYLKNLLKQNNISFDLDSATKPDESV